MSPHDTDEESLPDSNFLDDDLMLPPKGFYQTDNISSLSLEEVVGDKHDFSLKNVDPSFYPHHRGILHHVPKEAEQTRCFELSRRTLH